MIYSPESIAVLKRDGRLEAQVRGERGRLDTLSLEELVVCVGAPVGSISGWLGSLSWQVWIEPFHVAGQVRAQLQGGEKLDWRMDESLSKEALLDAAKVRLISLAREQRQAQLREVQSGLAQLEAAMS